MSADERALVAQTVEKLLGGVRDHTDNDTVVESAAGWKLLADHGMTRVSVPEPEGAGESLMILGALLKTVGRCAFSVPLIDTHVGILLLQAAGLTGGLDDADGAGACAVGLDPRLLCPAAPKPSRLAVVHPGLAETIVTATSESDVDTVRIDLWRWTDLGSETRRNAAGEPTAVLDPDKLPAPSISSHVPAAVARAAARIDSVGRSLMIAGAAERALEQTLGYVAERQQFGRALSAFQSVQHTVAQMASLVTAASMSAAAALAVLDDASDSGEDATFERDIVPVLSSRIQCLRTAAFVARTAHQMHGAIGFTQEHSLRFSTTRLTSWRAHGTTQTEVANELGRRAYSTPDLWSLVTGEQS